MSRTGDEIASQPELWARALAGQPLVDAVAPGERVLALGCGTSAFVAMAYACLRESAGVGETDWAYASEAPVGRHYDRVLALSRSGTTTEVVEALGRFPGAMRIGITAVGGGPLSRRLDRESVVDWADEQSVVQTRFPTTVLCALRASLGIPAPDAVQDCRTAVDAPLPVDPSGFDHFVFLGSGWTVGLAHEAALKIREAAQSWSESYPAMDFRHGPIAVAHPRTLVWVFGEVPPGLEAQVGQSGATVVTSDLDPLAHLVLAQRLAVALAESRGMDPDRPRALSRSVVLDGAR